PWAPKERNPAIMIKSIVYLFFMGYIELISDLIYCGNFAYFCRPMPQTESITSAYLLPNSLYPSAEKCNPSPIASHPSDETICAVGMVWGRVLMMAFMPAHFPPCSPLTSSPARSRSEERRVGEGWRGRGSPRRRTQEPCRRLDG